MIECPGLTVRVRIPLGNDAASYGLQTVGQKWLAQNEGFHRAFVGYVEFYFLEQKTLSMFANILFREIGRLEGVIITDNQDRPLDEAKLL